MVCSMFIHGLYIIYHFVGVSIHVGYMGGYVYVGRCEHMHGGGQQQMLSVFCCHSLPLIFFFETLNLKLCDLATLSDL